MGIRCRFNDTNEIKYCDKNSSLLGCFAVKVTDVSEERWALIFKIK
jgi:hypothetical protein